MTPDYSGKLLADRYLLRRCIGLGGMATVYEAIDRVIQKPVAVKILNPQYASQPEYLARFRQEAQEAARIRHEHLVDVTDQGSTPEGLAFFVMEFLRGETLQSYLHPSDDEARPVSWRMMVAIVVQICDALQHAHEHNVVHRDIKPGNVFLLTRRPGEFRVKVLDLGIAKVLHAHDDPKSPLHTRMSQGTPGTPEYMSPEQVLGAKSSPQTDIYAVGVLMYRMLTGTLPFYSENSPYEVMDQHCKRAPEPLRTRAPSLQIPEAVEREVLRALAKRPEERHGSARELADTLRALEAAQLRREQLADEADDARTHQFEVPRAPGRGKTRLLSYLAAGLSGMTLSVTFFMVFVLVTVSGTRAEPTRSYVEDVTPVATAEPERDEAKQSGKDTPPTPPPTATSPAPTPIDASDDSSGADEGPPPTPTTGGATDDGETLEDTTPPVTPPPVITTPPVTPPPVVTPPPIYTPPVTPTPPKKDSPEKQLGKFLAANRSTLAKKCGDYKLFSPEKIPVKIVLPPAGGPPAAIIILGPQSKSPLGKCVEATLRKLTFPELTTTTFNKVTVTF